MRIREWRLNDGRIPQLKSGNIPLAETGGLLMSIAHEPRLGFTLAGKRSFTRIKANRNEALVYIDPMFPGVEDKAWFLHHGGYTSEDSAVPGQWNPPRPFMSFPWNYHRNYLKNIITESFKNAFINTLKYGAHSYTHLIDI